MTDVTDTPQVVIDAPAPPSPERPAGVGVIEHGCYPRLTHDDLAPLRDQSWTRYNIVAFGMSDGHSVGGYVTAGSLFALGLTGWQVFICLIVGISVVLFFCDLVAQPSHRTGVPFPVACRSVFGVIGADVPAIIGGLIAVAWYGIQTCLASAALDILVVRLWPNLTPYGDVGQHGFPGLSTLGHVTFTLLWAMQAAVINIVATSLSPAFDVSRVNPQKISWLIGCGLDLPVPHLLARRSGVADAVADREGDDVVVG